jgi:hypothetical protein
MGKAGERTANVGKSGVRVGGLPALDLDERVKQGLTLYGYAVICSESVGEAQGDDVGVHILEFTL